MWIYKGENQLDKFNDKPIKEYNNGINKYIEQHKKEIMDEKELFEEVGLDYTRFRLLRLCVIFLVICSILGIFMVFVRVYVNNQERIRSEKLELINEELSLETSYAKNLVKNIIVEDKLVYKNGITIPLANKYIGNMIKSYTIDKKCIENNISNFTKVIKVTYENKKYHNELENENFLTEFGEKLVEVEGYEEREVIGEEGKVYFRNEKNGIFTYIIINDYDITYGIAKDNVDM